MRAMFLVGLAAALTLTGCPQPPGPPIPPPPLPAPVPEPAAAAGPMVLQVEDFTLTDAKVVDLAGGGKAVVLSGEMSTAKKEVPMKKGAYEVTVYALAPSYDEDAFYVSVGDGPEERLFPEEINQVLPTGPVKVTLAADGPCKILFAFGEPNVQLDRVEIKAVK